MGTPEGGELLESNGISSKVILKWVLRTRNGRTWSRLNWLRIWTNRDLKEEKT